MKNDTLKMRIWKKYKKLFPTKCFIVMGNKVPDVPFSNKEERENSYLIMPVTGTT